MTRIRAAVKRLGFYASVWCLGASAVLPGCADFSRGPMTEVEEPPEAPEPSGEGGVEEPGDAPSFAAEVYPLLVDGCVSCHSPTGNAAGTGWVLRNDVQADLGETLRFVDEAMPAQSRLLTKTAGLGHGGGRVYRTDSPEYAVLLAWIREGMQP